MLHTHLTLETMTLMWITATILNKADCVQTNDIMQPDSSISADVGENVTLRCFKRQEDSMETIVWYKQKMGQEPCVLVSIQSDPFFEEEFRLPRFSIQEESLGCHLNIAQVERSDEAVYYCGLRKFTIEFGKGTFLAVKRKPDVKVSVIQRGVWDSVPTGGSRATLQCSVLSERTTAELRVLWFRSAPSQSHPQIIYTHHNNNNNNNTDQRRSSTRTCVYNISVNDTGTYYCAVALCGRIVFGNGTLVQLENVSQSGAHVMYGAAVSVCVIVIFAQAFIICKMRPREPIRVRAQKEKTSGQGGDAAELNYAALRSSARKATKVMRKNKQPGDCVYSEVSHAF